MTDARHIPNRRLALWTAHLAAPARPLAADAGAMDEALLGSLPAFWRANKVPMLSLRRSSPEHPIWDAPAVAAALEAEASSFAGQRAEFELVRRAWEGAGIRPMFIKAVGIPPSFPHTSDNLDAYIPPAQGPAARRILRELGYVELRNIEEPNKYLFKRFRAGDEVCAVHLHLRLEWSVSFLFEDRAWERRRIAPDDASLSIPSLEDALLITLAHALYENKALKLGDVMRVHHCLEHALDWEYIWHTARSKGWAFGLAFALLAHDKIDRWLYAEPALPEAERRRAAETLRGPLRRQAEAHLTAEPNVPFPIRFLFSKTLFFEKMLRDENEPWGRRLGDVGTHLVTGIRQKLRLYSQPAMLVAISGVDGSGKSTQAGALEHAFKQCALRTRCVWGRGGATPFAGAIIRVGKRLLGRGRAAQRADAGEVDPETRRQALFRSPWARRLWPWLILVELTGYYFRRVRIPLWRGHVVICDRYTADALAEMAARLEDPAIPDRLPARLLRRLSPRPHMVIYLAIDPRLARERQPAHLQQGTPELAEHQAAMYNRLMQEEGAHVFDGTRRPEELSDAIVYDVLSDYFAGFHTFLNIFLLSNPKPCSAGREHPASLPPRPAPMPFTMPARDHAESRP